MHVSTMPVVQSSYTCGIVGIKVCSSQHRPPRTVSLSLCGMKRKGFHPAGAALHLLARPSRADKHKSYP